MLKNVLERQGYCFGYDSLNGVSIYEDEGDTLVYVSGLFRVGFTNEETLYEQACKQFVRENGFKRSLFSKEVQEDLKRLVWIRDLLEHALKEYTDEKEVELIAWLYSEDIKIVEE